MNSVDGSSVQSTVDASDQLRARHEAIGGRLSVSSEHQLPSAPSHEAMHDQPAFAVEGEGDAWIFTGGHLISGRWKRDNLEAVTVYTDGDGNPIELTVGTTWIELAPPGSATLK